MTPAQRAVDSGLITIHGQSEHSSKRRGIGGDRRYWITFGAAGRVSGSCQAQVMLSGVATASLSKSID